ncbi:hypothetical protein [Roseinatronobacter monicus]|uniref:YpeB-like protein with protease inhibitory function n=1 Tax=Roseinatronobacter monicus TaxID=393481 RepID=A0A543KI58_9RHOB|nr:hypothetical protein [Roseinatronobacter monicus]TQM94763.1 hypothetical protein BD293_3450 [Roseinatronobacter monicus]
MKRFSTFIMLIFLASATAVAGQSGRGMSIVDVERSVGREGNDHYIAVLQTLEQRGYSIVEVSSTLLNRLRIWAENNVHRREIVVSRANGRILRDVIVETYKNAGADPQVIPVIPIEDLLQNHSGGIRIVPNP